MFKQPFIGLSLSFIIAIIIAIATTATAQRSVQSVMTVTADIVRGATITHQVPASIDPQLLYETGIQSFMGTITVKSNLHSRVDIYFPSEILMTTDEGETVPLDFAVERKGAGGNNEYRYSGRMNASGSLRGIYYGQHNTVVLYN